MIARRARKFFSVRNVLLLVLGLLILHMGSSFVQQAGAHRQRQEDLDRLDRRLELARQEEKLLEEELEYVQSHRAAEAWARRNGWAKPDEVSVVVVAPPAVAVQQEGTDSEEGHDAGTYRELWWDLFFGRR